jgi:autotransporter translocation and assembly factor TamB
MEKDRVHIAEFTLDAKETTVAVSGDIGTSSTQPGQLTYALHVGNVAPWLSLAEQQGTGALHLTGKAQGSISNLQLQGELQTQGLQVATNTIQDGSVTYQLENIGQPHPSGAITAKLQNIDAGVTLKHAEVKVLLPKNLQPTAPVLAQVDLSLQDAALRTNCKEGLLPAARVTAGPPPQSRRRMAV